MRFFYAWELTYLQETSVCKLKCNLQHPLCCKKKLFLWQYDPAKLEITKAKL